MLEQSEPLRPELGADKDLREPLFRFHWTHLLVRVALLHVVHPFSDRRDRTSVDDVLGAVNRGGAIGDQKRDQLGDFLWPVGAADGNAAQRVHQTLTRRALVDSVLLGEALNQAMRRARFRETRCDCVHADAPGSYLVRQSLTVS